MLAWIFDSLSRRADKWVSEWDSSSGELARQRYPLLQRVARLFAEHPAAHSITICVCSASLSFVCWVLPSKFGVQIAVTEYSQSDLLTYFSTLWTLQATLAALVYPLVIAFVAVMLQRRAAAKLSLHLYTIDAGVAPSGISALALVAWMTILYMALPYAPPSAIAPAMVGCILWFLHNLLVTGWFLYRTVTFLDDSQRYQVLKRFAVRVAFPREVHNNLLGQMFSHAQSEGTLPGNDYGSDTGGPTVALYPISDGATVATIDNPELRTVIDIRLRPLRWGIHLWLRQVSKIQESEDASATTSLHALLVLPFTPGERQHETITVCRVENGPIPSAVALWLIRKSLVLRTTKNSQFEFTCAEILEELVIETLTLLEQKRLEAAKETIAALIDIHTGLIKAGSFKNSSGEPDNAVLLPSPYSIGSLRFHEDWIRTYRPLFETAVQSLPTSTATFEHTSYVAYRLVGQLKLEHLDILTKVLQLSANLMFRLGYWWTGQIQERGVVEHDANKAVVLSMPAGAVYERAMQVFVEGWEAVRIRGRKERFETASEAWDFHSKYALFTGAQFSTLCRMILDAVARGDKAGAAWLAESFAKWFGSHYFLSREFVHDNGRSAGMTLQDFKRPWSEIRQDIGGSEVTNEIALAAALTTRLLRRYWTDLQLVMSMILLDWVDPTQATASYSLELAVQFVAGQNPRTGREEMSKLMNPEALLTRIQAIHAVHDYCSVIDLFIAQAADIRRPSMVAGRVYSLSGANDLESLCRAQGHMLVACSTSQVRVTPKLRAVLEYLGNDNRSLSRAARLATDIVESINESERDGNDVIADALQYKLSLPNNLAASRDWARQLLGEFASLATTASQSVIAAASLSPSALRAIRRLTSAYIQSRENDQFPFTISKSFEPLGTDYPIEQRLATGVRKEPLTQPPLETFSENDYDHFGRVIAASVGARIVQEYIRRRSISPIVLIPSDAFCTALNSAAHAISTLGKTPLLIFSGTPPSWAGAYHAPEEAPDWPSNLTNSPPRDTDVQSLICYWNDIEAHRVWLKGTDCYVVAKEDFENLVYNPTTPTGDCLDVEALEDTAITINLNFSWTIGLQTPV